MINVRSANQQDLEYLVALHYSSGVIGLLSKLTPDQLSAFYYRPLLASRRDGFFVAENVEDGQIVGLIATSTHSSPALAGSLLIRFKMGLRILTRVFRFPDLIVRFLHYLAGNRFLTSYKNSNDCFEIDLLLVDGSAQSSGIGSILMDFFLELVGQKARIVVQTQNIEALNFYSKFGFNVIWKKSILGVGLWICERKI